MSEKENVKVEQLREVLSRAKAIKEGKTP